MKLFLALGILLAIQSLVSLREGFAFLRYVRRSRSAPLRDYSPVAAVIIPCKGIDAGFQLNVTSFMTQEYPHYQLIFAVDSKQDPAWSRLAELTGEKAAAGAASPHTELVVAGLSESRADKVNNIRRALEAVAPEAEVLVFADADGRPKPAWLRSLVAPLADPAVTVSTGFRWYLPGQTFASRLRAAWDTSVATMLGDHGRNFAWGGSMAIRAADFRRLRIAADYWANTASDDYALTRAVRQAGGRICFEPQCLLASREESTVGEFLRWANRQIIMTRVYAPHLWRMGLASYLLYCGTFALGVVLLSLPSVSWRARGVIAAMLLAVLALGIAKGGIRTLVAREAFPEESASLARYGSCYWQLAPLVPWCMLVNFMVAGFVRRIEWRGVHYHLRSSGEIQVLKRD
jgi:ceramide glucosyltransferase